MMPRGDSYEAICKQFRWEIPERFNMGVACCDRHAAARPDDLALIFEDEAGNVAEYTWRDLQRASNQLANTLHAHGIRRGDRVAVLLSQSLECGVGHVAAHKAGMISVPLFALFGEEAIEFRLQNCGAAALITDLANVGKVLAIRDRLPELRLILVVGARPGQFDAPGVLPYAETVAPAPDQFTPVDTAAEDPAFIIFTSGTTGNPKGALHAHRALLGHLPGVQYPHEFFPQPGDRYWTPADWAWIGGLLNVLLVGWCLGVTIVGKRFKKFDPHAAVALMARHGVRNTFLPPTALKLMRQAGVAAGHGAQLRTIASGGETLGDELLDWGRATFGVTINEFYGQTECNVVVGNCSAVAPIKPGSMGRAVPGHDVRVINEETGAVLPPNTIGHIAVRAPDPVMMLGYWNNPEATKKKYVGDWLLTGDLGRIDDVGYIWYQSRTDDLITSGGYRIGPSEIEDCLLKHPVVALAGVIGVPDPIRTEAIKAFVVLKPGTAPSPALVAELQDHVRHRLAAHEYPRDIEFVDSLPMTATGKILRRELREREQAKSAARQ